MRGAFLHIASRFDFALAGVKVNSLRVEGAAAFPARIESVSPPWRSFVPPQEAQSSPRKACSRDSGWASPPAPRQIRLSSHAAAPTREHVLESGPHSAWREDEEAVARLDDRRAAWRDRLAVARDDRYQGTARQAELAHLGAGDRVVPRDVELDELE